MRLVCEGDEIAYRCAFACEKQAYIVATKNSKHDFKNKYTKTDIVKYFKTKDKVLDVDYILESYKILEPEHIVNYTLDQMIKKLWLVEHPELPKITEVEFWLSPSDHSNFRYNVVNIMGSKGLGYKAGRGEKPHYLPHIRDRLIRHYGALEATGYEADDALGMAAKEGVILSHIDKDMNMIEGWHYNHVSHEVYYIEAGLGSIEIVEGRVVGRGLLFFYLQLLTGDAIDNIPGCLNAAKAHYSKPPIISAPVGVTMLQEGSTEADAFNTVATAFQYTYKDNWLSAIMECADLLWICRKTGETGRQYLMNRGFI